MRFFVYGTLLKGEGNHRVVAPYVESIEAGTIRGTLYNYGPYPFLVRTDTGKVFGEWVTIQEGMEPKALSALDRLEGYREGDSGNLYDRVRVQDLNHPEIEGYVYVFPEDSSHMNIREFPVIVQEDWRRRNEPLYFAYGSCMNEEDFLRTCPKGHLLALGLLLGYTLRFNGYSPSRNGGVANIEKQEGALVEGVLWAVPEDEIDALDQREGHPYFYRRMNVWIRVKHGIVQVFTYQLVEGDLIDYPPSPDYLSLILSAPVSEKYKDALIKNWSLFSKGNGE